MACRLLLTILAILAIFNLSHLALAQDPVQPDAPAENQRCFFNPGGNNVIEPPPTDDKPVPKPTSCPDGSKPQAPVTKLKKRTLIAPDNFDDQPPGRKNNFIFHQIKEGRDQGNLVPHAGRDRQFNALGGISSSKFLEFRNSRFNTGVEGLHGCTTVVIVAKRGTWISHHWEIPGFLNMQLDNNGVPIPGSESDVSDAEFQSRVLDFFRLGDSTGGQTNMVFPGFALKTAPGEVFGRRDELLKVMIVTPRDAYGADAPAGIQRFPALVQKIKDEIKSIFKDVNPDLDPEVVDYNVLNSGDPNKEVRHGTVLVQYDPRQQPPGQPVRTAIVRIWVQGDQVGGNTGDITWDPLPTQRKRDLFARQAPAADDPCPEVNIEDPTTLVTSAVPTPTNLPPANNNYRIKLHQWMEGENSFLEWTQIDSNGQTVAGPSREGVIPKSDNPHRTEILIHVSEPTNKDLVRVEFTLNTDQLHDNCKPVWNIGSLEGGESNFSDGCSFILNPFYGCDQPNADMWKPINAGFERDFECFYMDLNLQSTFTSPLIPRT